MIDRRILAAVARRPSLWVEAGRAALSIAPRSWWRRPPYVPLPEPQYAAWRVHTAYGDSTEQAAPSDVVAYLEWRKRQRSQG